MHTKRDSDNPLAKPAEDVATTQRQPLVSIIIPAFNEERYLHETVLALRRAVRDVWLVDDALGHIEIIVVDNGSTDSTQSTARELRCQVVSQSDRGVSKARNAGAQASNGDWLLFLDADTLITAEVLRALLDAISDCRCIGGAFLADRKPTRTSLRLYYALWERYARCRGLTQGFAQFCHSDTFCIIGGYDPTIVMGEDNEFFLRLRHYAKRVGGYTVVPSPRVHPSDRRDRQWPTWKILLWTNPVMVLLFRRSPWFWHHWTSARHVPR